MAFDVYYWARNTSSDTLVTGDAANHTVNVEVDGSEITGLTEAEVGNGLYRVELSDAQLPEGSRFAAYGSSSTSDVEILGETGVRPQSKTGYKLASDGLDQIVPSEPGSVPAFDTATLPEWIVWTGALNRNKLTQTADTQTLRNDDDDADLATAAIVKTSTVFTRGEWS